MENLAFRNTLLNNWTSAWSGVTVPVIRRTSPHFEVTCFHGSYLQGAFNAAERSHLISMKSTINQWTDSALFLSFRRKTLFYIWGEQHNMEISWQAAGVGIFLMSISGTSEMWERKAAVTIFQRRQAGSPERSASFPSELPSDSVWKVCQNICCYQQTHQNTE